MKQTLSARRNHTLGAWATVAALLGLTFCLGTHAVMAQNAAQQAALARLAHARASVHSQLTMNGEASNAALRLPQGLAYDAAGDLFIADTADNLVREVDLNGVITTVAGTGEQGFAGDGGPAASALLDGPTGIAVDAAGSLYIADTHNNRIRKVSAGTITTIAGTGVAGFSGDGGAASAAALSQPTAIAIDANGNLYIADTNNNRIREIAGTTINTVAGNGDQIYSGDGGLATAAGLDSPGGVAVDAAFNLYIGDTHNQRVRMVAHSTGIISTLAGTGEKSFTADGAAASAALARPRGVAVDSAGTVYVADSDNQRIRSIDGGQVATIAGSGNEGYSGDAGAATSASLDEPATVALQNSSVAISDTENNAVRLVTNGEMNTIAGSTATQKESLAISGATTVVYGTGALTATFANGSNMGTGQVTFYDGLGANPSLAGSASLSANTATLNTSLLNAGTHYLIASYAGDSSNPPITSGVFVLVVTPVQLTAVANTVNMLYGQPVPSLAGTLSGVLTRDAGSVTASYSTTATATSDPATYPISVALTGASAGNYTVVLGAASGSVVIAKASSTINLTTSSAAPILGTSDTLTATVSSTTSGTPTGTVNFYDGTTLLNTTPAPLSGGVATLTLTTLPVGANSLTAVYSGNIDFIASTSAAVSATVLPPQFTISASPSAQTVLPLHSVDFTITLTPANSTFVYPVTLSVSGLPAGVTASFSPASVAAGASTTAVTLTLSAGGSARLERNLRFWGGGGAALALLLPLFFTRRTRSTARHWSSRSGFWMAVFLLALASTLAGCGDGGFFSHKSQSSTVTVTAVSGPITQTTNVTLTVQ
jgi:sugar lactone lactonase YvrE